jgi:hypothetical protein
MKLKTLLLALFVAGLLVSAAVAAAPAKKPAPGGTTSTDTTATTTSERGKSQGKSQGKAQGKSNGAAQKPACKPARKLVLRGEFVALGGGGLALSVTGGNHGSKAWHGKQATVLVDAKTHVHGAKRALADLVAGDRLHVQGYACLADSGAGSLLARKIGVKGAKGEATSTGTTETETTTTAP